MAKTGNTFGILVPKVSTAAIVPGQTANPPVNIEGVEAPQMISMLSGVASSAVGLASGEANVMSEAAKHALALLEIVPGVPSDLSTPASKSLANSMKSGSPPSVGGSDGGIVTGSSFCVSCKNAALKGKPVNAVLGIKVLAGQQELDFAFDGTMPLVWQRSYYSDQIGNDWLGQGWSLPFSNRLVKTLDGFLYIDEQGREIPLPDVQFGDLDDDDEPYYDRHELIYFSAIAEDIYQISSTDGGIRLWFSAVNESDRITQNQH